MSTLDHIDLAILRALQKNARLTTKEVAAQVNLSSTPVFERIKRMERDGIIKQYVAIVDASKLNRGFTVFTSVKLRHCTLEAAREFIQCVENLPEVTECYNISGANDYLLKVNVEEYYKGLYLQNFIQILDFLSSLNPTYSLVCFPIHPSFSPLFLD